MRRLLSKNTFASSQVARAPGRPLRACAIRALPSACLPVPLNSFMRLTRAHLQGFRSCSRLSGLFWACHEIARASATKCRKLR